MDKIRELLKNPIYAGAVGLVVGVLFGLVVLGWWIFPVNWVNASPQNLRPDSQQEYLKMAIQSFAVDTNIQAAQQHWKDLGPNADNILAQLQSSNGKVPIAQETAFLAAIKSGKIKAAA